MHHLAVHNGIHVRSLPRPLMRSHLLVAFSAALCLTTLAAAQTPPPGKTVSVQDTTQNLAVRVFVDCEGAGCDYDFFRDDLKWANFVRDRMVSDVVLLVTSLRTGSGGSEYTIAAIGQDKYRGRADTLIVFANPNDANDIIRRQLAKSFGLLLAPYAARTPLASRLTLAYTAPATADGTPVALAKDPWNYWVYRMSVNGFSSGEKQQSFANGFLSTSANRVTKAYKISLSANLGYDQSRFQFADGGSFKNIQRNYGANSLIARSINNHVTVGATAGANFSDFNNYNLNLQVAPAIEWNYFDYKEFTRRQLTAYYSVGIAAMRYQDTTIYNRVGETRPQQNLTVSWNARQPWGSVNASVFGSQYLHDLSANSYGVSGFLDLRIAKGLALNVGGNYSRVNDQLFLRKGKLTDAQVIARQQALATNYRYFLNFGISYTFGSITNSVVNPRFGGGGRGGNQMVFSF